MQESHEKGLASRAASSFVLGSARRRAKRKQGNRPSLAFTERICQQMRRARGISLLQMVKEIATYLGDGSGISPIVKRPRCRNVLNPGYAADSGLWCGSKARADAIQRTSKTWGEQRLGGANRWECARLVANRKPTGTSLCATRCLSRLPRIRSGRFRPVSFLSAGLAKQDSPQKESRTRRGH